MGAWLVLSVICFQTAAQTPDQPFDFGRLHDAISARGRASVTSAASASQFGLGRQAISGKQVRLVNDGETRIVDAITLDEKKYLVVVRVSPDGRDRWLFTLDESRHLVKALHNRTNSGIREIPSYEADRLVASEQAFWMQWLHGGANVP